MMSGRNAAHSDKSCPMSSRARSGSLPRPWMTWTKPALSGSPLTSTVTSLLSRKVASPLKQFGGLGPPLVLFVSVAVALGRLLGLEAGQRDEPAVLGHSGGRAEPAGGTWRQLLNPPVERGARLPGVGYLSLNDLDEHREPFDRCTDPVWPLGCFQMLRLLGTCVDAAKGAQPEGRPEGATASIDCAKRTLRRGRSLQEPRYRVLVET